MRLAKSALIYEDGRSSHNNPSEILPIVWEKVKPSRLTHRRQNPPFLKNYRPIGEKTPPRASTFHYESD